MDAADSSRSPGEHIDGQMEPVNSSRLRACGWDARSILGQVHFPEQIGSTLESRHVASCSPCALGRPDSDIRLIDEIDLSSMLVRRHGDEEFLHLVAEKRRGK